MKEITGVCLVMLALGLLCLGGITHAAQADATETVLTDDIRPYYGTIGADSPLYGLKLALEDIDLSFTADETERLDKQMDHAWLRLSEVRRSLDQNQNESAKKALNNYWLKTDLTSFTITWWNSSVTGLLPAEEKLIKHQVVLENLLAVHPDNTGLQRAYSNSLALEEKFAEKTGIKYQRTIDQNNRIILMAIGLEQNNCTGLPDAIPTQTDDSQLGRENDQDNTAGSGMPVTILPTQHLPGNQQENGQSEKQNSNGSTNGNAEKV